MGTEKNPRLIAVHDAGLDRCWLHQVLNRERVEVIAHGVGNERLSGQSTLSAIRDLVEGRFAVA